MEAGKAPSVDPEVQNAEAEIPEICRDYVWGTCNKRTQCKYRHELTLQSMRSVLRFCQDFQKKDGCNRPGCSYLHTTKAEELSFLISGIIPRVLVKRYMDLNISLQILNPEHASPYPALPLHLVPVPPGTVPHAISAPPPINMPTHMQLQQMAPPTLTAPTYTAPVYQVGRRPPMPSPMVDANMPAPPPMAPAVVPGHRPAEPMEGRRRAVTRRRETARRRAALRSSRPARPGSGPLGLAPALAPATGVNNSVPRQPGPSKTRKCEGSVENCEHCMTAKQRLQELSLVIKMIPSLAVRDMMAKRLDECLKQIHLAHMQLTEEALQNSLLANQPRFDPWQMLAEIGHLHSHMFTRPQHIEQLQVPAELAQIQMFARHPFFFEQLQVPPEMAFFQNPFFARPPHFEQWQVPAEMGPMHMFARQPRFEMAQMHIAMGAMPNHPFARPHFEQWQVPAEMGQMMNPLFARHPRPEQWHVPPEMHMHNPSFARQPRPEQWHVPTEMGQMPNAYYTRQPQIAQWHVPADQMFPRQPRPEQWHVPAAMVPMQDPAFARQPRPEQWHVPAEIGQMPNAAFARERAVSGCPFIGPTKFNGMRAPPPPGWYIHPEVYGGNMNQDPMNANIRMPQPQRIRPELVSPMVFDFGTHFSFL